MTTGLMADGLKYEQFREQWVSEIEDGDPGSIEKGSRFASKIVTQWLNVTTDDDDFVICDGPGDGGIDIAYLKRSDVDSDDNSEEGDTWYLIRSKYGSAFAGKDTIIEEGRKVIATLQGENESLSEHSKLLLEKLDTFRQQASDVDRIVLVFATMDPILQQDRSALEDIKIIGRERLTQGFDVEEVSLRTIWDSLNEVEQPKLSVAIRGQFVDQYSGLLVGTVSLVDRFGFLKSYQNISGNLDELYEKNVRQFLGSRRKINKGIAKTLNENPERFGLYNNGITIVVSGYSKSPNDSTVTMNDPYIVNGCQTTRTIWQILDTKLNAGGDRSGYC